MPSLTDLWRVAGVVGVAVYGLLLVMAYGLLLAVIGAWLLGQVVVVP